MSLTATFDATTAKVTLVVASAPSGSSTAHLERSVDNITWTDVRGGQALTVSGGAATLIDYEYAAGVPNFYRATYNAVASFVAKGTSATANNADFTTPLPTGMSVGDLMFLFASTRSATPSGANSGLVTTPSGWTPVVSANDAGVQVFSRIHQTGDTAPTVHVNGGFGGDDHLGQITAFRGVNANGIQLLNQYNVSAQNIAYPSITAAAAGVGLILGWKQDDNTSVTTPSGYTLIEDISSTAGSDASQCWFYKLGIAKGDAVGSGTITVTGGAAAISRGLVITLSSGGQDTASVTPDQTVVWVKNPLRPFLNRPVVVTGIGDQTRDSRSGVFDIIARTVAVAVTDLMSGRTVPLTLRAANPSDAADIDDMLAVGEVLFVQPPVNSPVPTMYALPAGSTVSRVANTSSARNLPLNLTEVAMPDLSLAAVQSTCQTVINTYATVSDLIAAKATCADVLLLVGTAEDVITA